MLILMSSARCGKVSDIENIVRGEKQVQGVSLAFKLYEVRG